MNIAFTENTHPGTLPPSDQLGFGSVFTDHMFLMDYSAGKGWHDARIVPYGPISLSPAASVLHYGTEVFEGLKAYRRPDGGVQLFRPWENVARLNRSCERLGLPQLDPDDALQAIKELVRVDQRWVPNDPGTSLYIRPFLYSTDPTLALHGVHEASFVIILSPSGSYFSDGLKPVPIMVAHDLRGLDPERAVLFIGPAEVGELFRRVGDKAGLVQGGLEKPFVELDAVALKVALHLGDVAVEAEARHIGVALRLGLVQIALAVLGVERLRKLLDVVAMVAVLGELDGVLALDELEVAGLDALGELFDLVAEVVDIKLTPHVRAGPVEHARERVAKHAAAGVAHVHGAGGVGGDELDHVLLALEALAAAVGVRLALHVLNDVSVPLFAETEVQEAGAGDLNRSKVGAVELHVLGEDIRDLARVLAHGLGGGQAEGGGVVAVGGILGDLDRGDGLHAIGQQTLLHGGAVGAARQDGDLVLCALDHIHSFFPRSFVVDAAARCRAAKSAES